MNLSRNASDISSNLHYLPSTQLLLLGLGERGGHWHYRHQYVENSNDQSFLPCYKLPRTSCNNVPISSLRVRGRCVEEVRVWGIQVSETRLPSHQPIRYQKTVIRLRNQHHQHAVWSKIYHTVNRLRSFLSLGHSGYLILFDHFGHFGHLGYSGHSDHLGNHISLSSSIFQHCYWLTYKHTSHQTVCAVQVLKIRRPNYSDFSVKTMVIMKLLQ